MISLAVMVILYDGFQLSHAENLDCAFEDFKYWFKWYTCKVETFNNGNNDKIITGHTGTHQKNKVDRDVEMIHMRDMNVNFIPESIGLLFDLTGFVVRNCELTQLRTKDFLGMEHLNYLDLSENKLSIIPAYAFTPLTNLRSIDLSNNQIETLPNGIFSNNNILVQVRVIKNKIKFIGSTVFDDKTNLVRINFEGNICVSKYYYKIDELKKDIVKNCKIVN